MESLGELEQLVLLAVLQVGRDAYGVPVQQEIAQKARRDLTLATIYKTLSRLESKGLLTSRLGEPTAERGGRGKRFFGVSAAGRRAVRQSLGALHRLSAGLDLGLGVGLDTP
jgi:PadR family transcriptional regulator PadR